MISYIIVKVPVEKLKGCDACQVDPDQLMRDNPTIKSIGNLVNCFTVGEEMVFVYKGRYKDEKIKKMVFGEGKSDEED